MPSKFQALTLGTEEGEAATCPPLIISPSGLTAGWNRVAPQQCALLDLDNDSDQGLWSQELALIAAEQVTSYLRCGPDPPSGLPQDTASPSFHPP